MSLSKGERESEKNLMQPPQRLKGMEDRGPEAANVLAESGDVLASFLSSYGYRRVEVPILEETELFLRKSGGELASRMYTFTAPSGHRISLRPEFTSPVVRAYLEGLDTGPVPLRWQYQGPVFRYEAEDASGHRQFTQVGAELIGASGPWADAEVLALAAGGLSRLGVKGHRLVVGHLGFIAALLDSLGLSDRARLFLLSSIAALRENGSGGDQVLGRARSLGLFPADGEEHEAMLVPTNEEALALLERSGQNDAALALGVRSPEEVRERYFRKLRLSEDPGRFGEALELVTRIAQVSGTPEDAVHRARKLVKPGPVQRELDDLVATLEALSSYDLGIPVTVDFGLARGIAYYTGVVFELEHTSIAGGPTLGGGGRYDGLVQALGGPRDTPAMGFAWTLERAVEARVADRRGGSPKERAPALLLVRAQEAAAGGAAVREAERLRAQGGVVELEVSSRSLKESIGYARERGIQRILTVSTNGEVKENNVPERPGRSSARRT